LIIKTQPRAGQHPCFNRSIPDHKKSGILFLPASVCFRAVLSGISLYGHHARNPGTETCRVQERGPGTGKVLNAEEKIFGLGGRPHQEGLGLSLAGLEGDTGIS